MGAFFAVKFGLTNTKGVIDNQTEHFLENGQKLPFTNSKEWQTFKSATLRDEKDLNKASVETEVPTRLLVVNLAVEQLRLFYSNRELFKKAFYPLKVLGNQSQFSWGVMGLKQETAIQIEKNLKNLSSPFYLGKKYEHLLDFKTTDTDKERFERIVDENSRYYSYLYSALFLKQIMKQWESAGFPIKNRPEILSTLFNIGFEHSLPKPNPQIGGAEIKIGDITYSFGGLAGEIFNSSELEKEFPR